ncbi:MAG: 4Fe-4S binding protein [Candidatus Cloacimonetes bacterium]|nr:4Fe-4S binding protein [Candidatus Cloacimonadota bacterium]
MKVLIRREDRCTGCGACEKVCSLTWFKEENPAKSRIRVSGNESGYSLNACTQCGDCMLICPVEALTRDKSGIVRLNLKACVGCLNCVGFCPSLSMFVAPGEDKPFKCIACGICVKACPTDALSIEEVDEPVERVFYRRHL